jgi:hypothetical protein
MKSSIHLAGHIPSARKFMVAVALAALLGGLSISPALAAKHDDHGQGDRHAKKGKHGWHGEKHAYRPQYRPEYQRPYYYAEPVYVPPPVYYEPRQSPGVTLFFPLDLRR